ncbi:hypothetical protein CJF42_22485 [Pseudoalteromonas sp. NBT06-2]|uniref:glycosyltransferase family protein n=1 Tax=Pseudoalteromonas sp. NBT06-2 TaxID=2025950 RepID=UPI000BA67629|nr:glycosyltransferase [Pseudoalteromonas sp. NBT06-2]PAJ72191.1 hypothetical protein CJF42_22485 [Pseudoalteromonas sp. NBT06-2]
MQQNLNVFTLTGNFGIQAQEWLATSEFKQLFWFLGRPDSGGSPSHLFYLLKQGAFNNAIFLCASKQYEDIFELYSVKTHYFPSVVDSIYIDSINNQDPKQEVIYWSDTAPSLLLADRPKETLALLASPEDMTRSVINLFYLLCLQTFPELKKDQDKNFNIFLKIVSPHLLEVFKDYGISSELYESKRNSFFSSIENKLNKDIFHTLKSGVLQLDNSYGDFITNNIYQKTKDIFQGVGGSQYWDNIGADNLISLEKKFISFKNTNITVSHSAYFTMSAPSNTPFEVFLSGGFSLSEHRAEIYDLLPITEKITYSSISELKELIFYYNKNKDLRLDIAARAKEHINQYHTYKNTASELVRLLNK